MLTPLAEHADIWAQLHAMIDKNRLAHALLFIAPRHTAVDTLINRLMALLLCENTPAPCGSCRACRWVIKKIHPDIYYLNQSDADKVIKIDQIRSLQESIHQTAQQGGRRIVLIERADKLNVSAANGLLKLLEEPPANRVFILIAEHLATLPLTIISRCQRLVVPVALHLNPVLGYLSLGELYPESSARAALTQQGSLMLMKLLELKSKTSSPTLLATQWATYSLDDLIWFFYLLSAQLIRMNLSPEEATKALPALVHLARHLNPVDLYTLLEQLNALKRIVDTNISLNATLVIESFLINLQRAMETN